MNSDFIQSSLGEPLNSVKSFLQSAHNEITIIAPYTKKDSLLQIIPTNKTKISIITTWKLQDLWMGSSDLSLYPLTKEKSIKLFINNRIHLKVFMSDWGKCIFGSANLTGRGLGTSNNYNYELNMLESNIDVETLLYFRRILAESILVNDTIYEQYKERLNELPPKQSFQEPALANIHSDSEFLISSLPMSLDINSLFNLYANNFSTSDKEASECAMHDIALYQIPIGLSQEKFIHHLKNNFFESPFIKKLLDYIDDEEKYFGQIKAWIQNNCRDVPVPSRRDLTGNIQVLYKWIVQLSDGKYLVDTPNYSERIFRAKK